MIKTITKNVDWIKVINCIALLAGVIVLICLFIFAYLVYQPNSKIKFSDPESSQSSQLKLYTPLELGNYDGSDTDLPILVAINGEVYDVSSGSRFYAKGSPYSYLAGKDATIPLQVVGTEIITDKYPKVGLLVETK
jgi:predicted heme/steroid binding protein